MKTKSLLLAAFAFATAALSADAAQIIAGPKGGRLLDASPLKAEFFVTADRRVEITFYDTTLQPEPPATQVVTVIAETPSGQVPVALEPSATGFVSTAALPVDEPYRVVVQVRAAPGAKPQNFRIDLSLATCGECRQAEYACTCESH
jgi:hypothetical protein